MGRPISRIEDRVDRLLLKIDLEPYFKAIRASFLPFKEEVSSITKFDRFFMRLKDYESSRGIIPLTTRERHFLESVSELTDQLSTRFDFYNSNITTGLIQKILFNEISPKLNLSVSHQIKSTEDDNAPYDYAEIYIEPGASKEEVLKYIRSNWSTIKKSLHNSLDDDNPVLKKVRPKLSNTKNAEFEIFELIKENPNLSDAEIGAKLNFDIDLGQIRKMVRKIKGKDL